MNRCTVSIVSLMALSVLGGCSKPEFEVTRVSGRVVCNGEPVTGGMIYFTPVRKGNEVNSGRVALAVLSEESQGHFDLTTYELGDGAIIGPVTISYMPPDMPEMGKRPAKVCATMKPFEFTIPPEGFDSLTVDLSEGKAF